MVAVSLKKSNIGRATPNFEIKLDAVARHLLDEGIVASDEVIEKGIEEYNMEIGESSSKDIAINIKNELLQEEEERKVEAGKERRGYFPKKRKIGFKLIHPEVPRKDRIDFHIKKEELNYDKIGRAHV